MFDTPVQQIGTISLLLACGYALWRGGRTERLGAIFTLAAWWITPILQNRAGLQQAQIGIFAIDALYFLSLFYLALRSDRYWPLWATGLQLLEVIMHIDMLIDHKVWIRAYYIGMEIWSYLVLVALVVGTWLETPRVPVPANRSPTSNLAQ